jgi:hypothetical protein
MRPFRISPSPKVSSPDCNVIFRAARAKLNRLADRPFLCIRPMDHRGTYHWHNAMSLTILMIFARPFEDSTGK